MRNLVVLVLLLAWSACGGTINGHLNLGNDSGSVGYAKGDNQVKEIWGYSGIGTWTRQANTACSGYYAVGNGGYDILRVRITWYTNSAYTGDPVQTDIHDYANGEEWCSTYHGPTGPPPVVYTNWIACATLPNPYPVALGFAPRWTSGGGTTNLPLYWVNPNLTNTYCYTNSSYGCLWLDYFPPGSDGSSMEVCATSYTGTNSYSPTGPNGPPGGDTPVGPAPGWQTPIPTNGWGFPTNTPGTNSSTLAGQKAVVDAITAAASVAHQDAAGIKSGVNTAASAAASAASAAQSVAGAMSDWAGGPTNGTPLMYSQGLGTNQGPIGTGGSNTVVQTGQGKMPGSTWPTIGTEVPVFNVPLSSLNDGGQIVGLVDVGMGLDDAKISSTVTTIRGVLLFLVTAGFFLMSYRTLGRAGGM